MDSFSTRGIALTLHLLKTPLSFIVLWFSRRKKAFEAALLAELWRIKYDDIKWPKSGKAFGSRKSMVRYLTDTFTANDNCNFT